MNPQDLHGTCGFLDQAASILHPVCASPSARRRLFLPHPDQALFRGDRRFQRFPHVHLVIGFVDDAALFCAGLVLLLPIVILGRFQGEHETDDLRDFGAAWPV